MNLKEAKGLHKDFGGGVYGAVAVVTFFWIWIPGTYSNWMNAWNDSTGIINFIIFEFIFDFGVEEVILISKAVFWGALWPIYWFLHFG